MQLWLWQADREASGDEAVRMVETRGQARPLEELPEERQLVSGTGVWKASQWRVVMKRSLLTERGQGPQLVPGHGSRWRSRPGTDRAASTVS